MKTTAVFVLCGFLLLRGIESSPQYLKDKIHHKYRPSKDSALLEKPLVEAETSIEEDQESSAESSPFDFDLNELLGRGKQGASKIKDLFSEVWSELFGSSDDSARETDRSTTEVESPDTEEEDFFHGILQLMRPWWKGPNVCTREEESEEEEKASDGDFFSSLLTSCQDHGKAYKCTMKIGRNGKVVVRTLTYECCYGWTRDARDRGCTKRAELSDMTSTLRDLNLTAFVDTMNSIGLNSKFAEGNYTIFAQTNSALAAVTGTEEISFVLLDTGDKMQFVREILLGHMVPGWEYSHEWTDEMTLQTEKDGSSVRINFYDYPAPFSTVNCARILSTDTQTTGGLIHTVDKVIMPARQSIWDILGQDQGRFAVFSSIVSQELQEKLMDTSQHFTVLAFTDEEFEKLPEDVKQQIRDKEGCFLDFAEQLVIPHTICSAAIQNDAVVRNLAGKLINASLEDESGENDGAISFNGVPVEAADRIATNGVIHVMKGVVFLDHMISTAELVKRKSGDVFYSLLGDAELLNNLPESVTLFVPPNEKLLDANLDDNTGRINILKNHIVDGETVLSRRNPTVEVTTEAGRIMPLSVRQNNLFMFHSRPTVTLGCAKILRANVRGCDGVAHFVDRVLTIPSKSVMEILRENEEVAEFVSLLEITGLDSILNADNFTGTVLAPTDAAFEAHISSEDKEKLLGDSDKLKSILKQHILKDSVCCNSMGSTSFFERNRYETLAGNYLVSSGAGPSKRIGGAGVTQCDSEATNGIVHLVDRPIIRRREQSILDMLSRGRQNFNWNIDWPF